MQSSETMTAGAVPFLVTENPMQLVSRLTAYSAKPPAARWFLARLFFEPEDGGHISPKLRFIYGLHGTISQKMAKLK
jgi:hypothetical protein